MLNNQINYIQSLQQTFDDMSFLLGCIQIKTCSANHYLMAMAHKIFEKIIKHHIGNSAHLEFDDDAHAVAVTFVVDVRDAIYFLSLNQFGNFLDELSFIYLIRNLCNNNSLSTAVGHLYFCLGANKYPTPTCFKSFSDTGQALNNTACWKIGTCNIIHKAFDRNVRVVNVCEYCISNFS